MFPVVRSGSLRVGLFHRFHGKAGFTSTPRRTTSHPNPPLNLDPSLQALLKDVNISLTRDKTRSIQSPRELEALPVEERLKETSDAPEDEFHTQRKSPAAHFGSQQIGAVIIPSQLQNSINAMISDSDRIQLHSDAKRLFYDSDAGKSSDGEWETQYGSKYRSRHQKSRHAERDGTAFASVALPAHYSAIVSVFDHLKRRLEPTWRVEQIIDWGAGTGSGLWASLYSFQEPKLPESDSPIQNKKIYNSTIATYLGIDKREGLVAIGKRLCNNVEMGKLNMSWQKSFKDEDKIQRSEGHNALALSAFMLTALPTPQARKSLVKEMWESGAHVMVLMDHNTTAGFEAIAEARRYLLNMSKKEFTDAEADEWPVRGAHVVAPCPHDGECPLYNPGSTQLVCGFTQRIQRPAFLRLTKHSGTGHEDIEYSYVVIRRGPRPSPATTNVGRIGEVGKRALDKEALSRLPIRELRLHEEYELMDVTEETPAPENPVYVSDQPQSHKELQEALRMEAYSWPRLVFPPLKKSGHIILDSCTPEGKIMRLTIPRSQGKQEYYDARKSSWGDLFPHPPKNPPQERYQLRPKREGGSNHTSGADIGKRRESDRKKERNSYKELSKDIKEGKKKPRRDRVREPHLDESF